MHVSHLRLEWRVRPLPQLDELAIAREGLVTRAACLVEFAESLEHQRPKHHGHARDLIRVSRGQYLFIDVLRGIGLPGEIEREAKGRAFTEPAGHWCRRRTAELPYGVTWLVFGQRDPAACVGQTSLLEPALGEGDTVRLVDAASK